MDIGVLICLAIVSTITLLILALRIMKWSTLIKHHLIADVGFTVGTFILLSGSMTGMIISILSGLFFSIVLSIGKWLTPKNNLQ
jgi:hypothetical protein